MGAHQVVLHGLAALHLMPAVAQRDQRRGPRAGGPELRGARQRAGQIENRLRRASGRVVESIHQRLQIFHLFGYGRACVHKHHPVVAREDQVPSFVESAQAIKEAVPTCKVVVGGWHASYMPETLVANPEIDYAVMGEGERAIVELATAITSGNEAAALSIAGVACKRQGTNILNPAKFIENMDEIPYPARHLLPLEQYDRTIEFLKAKPADVMSISRGCVFNCGFCETRKLWGNMCRSFSPKRVIGEIQDLQSRYGTKGIYFINDNFTLRKKETLELCNMMVEGKLDLEWVCDTRVDIINQELVGG